MGSEPVYCALCDEPARWLLGWTILAWGGRTSDVGEQPVCDEHLGPAQRTLRPEEGVGCWSITLLTTGPWTDDDYAVLGTVDDTPAPAQHPWARGVARGG